MTHFHGPALIKYKCNAPSLLQNKHSLSWMVLPCSISMHREALLTVHFEGHSASSTATHCFCPVNICLSHAASPWGPKLVRLALLYLA